jgi:hypothetical protein
VSAYGADHISTPNIDQIGAEGVIFEEGYVTSPTCAPSRAGIMTGRVWPTDSTQKMVCRAPILFQSLVVRVCGANFDLAMFNVDHNYSISLNSATKTSFRTGYHQIQLNLAYLF